MGKITHGHTLKGSTPTYRVWSDMRQRCLNPACPCYPRYGGRGISVCLRWGKFANFLADMGSRPSSGLSLERIDNEDDYKPSNCRWATVWAQTHNRRDNKLSWEKVAEIHELIAKGWTQRAIAKKFGVEHHMIWRVKKGLSWGNPK